MSHAPATLPTGPFDDPGLDYLALREEGIRRLQRMAGDLWTDYNFSDPGVTTLEQLCYALTELSYRALYPVADLLADPVTGQVQPWRQALYPAPAILPANPVTANDLRRLILDRVRNIGNVWFTPLPAGADNPVGGLYHIQILVAREDPCCCPDPFDSDPEAAAAVRRVLERYCGHRALCEDVGSVSLLRPIPTAVTADVMLSADANASQVMAELLFAIALAMAPEPRRTSFDAKLASGASTADIFDGPLMLRGFIDDSQLRPLPTALPVSQLTDVMAAQRGVLLVEKLRVRTLDQPRDYADGETVPIPADSLLALITAAEHGRYPIRLFQGATECRPDPRRVQRLLNRKWALHRRTYDLWRSYREQYRPPQADRRALTAYSSVQDQFPNVYGINAYGLPPAATAARRGQAKQFKGYLMPFDQLMADYFSQLARIRDLYSPRAGGSGTYAWQSLVGSVPAVEPLLSPDYVSGMDELVAGCDPVRQRQAQFLTLLLSLYAERPSVPSGKACGGSMDGPSQAQVHAQRELLIRTPRATADRGRGYDYRRPLRQGGGTGMEIRCRIELDLIDDAARCGDGDGCDTNGNGATAVDDPDQASFGRPLAANLRPLAESRFLPLDRMLDELGLGEFGLGDGEDGEADGPGVTGPLSGQRIATPLLEALSDVGRYRMGFMPDQGTLLLVCQASDGNWWLVGEYRSPSQALTSAHRLLRGAGRRRRRLFIVEHTLLRYAMEVSAAGSIEADGATYSFRISAIIGATQREAMDVNWREAAKAVLRRNTPSHIRVDCLFLGRERMRRFLTLRAGWMDALSQSDPGRRARASLRLERFLQTCRIPDPDDATVTTRP
ncbi:hypothetical protein EI613_17170 [Azospirillum sp. 412522]|nr:hypothetical protein [Azospirillum sp. 412522]MBY6263631.1 hypothetical protein [Azospirillum sp. 412522]